MSERLFDGESTAFETMLIEAGREEQPPEQLMARMLAPLGPTLVRPTLDLDGSGGETAPTGASSANGNPSASPSPQPRAASVPTPSPNAPGVLSAEASSPLLGWKLGLVGAVLLGGGGLWWSLSESPAGAHDGERKVADVAAPEPDAAVHAQGTTERVPETGDAESTRAALSAAPDHTTSTKPASASSASRRVARATPTESSGATLEAELRILDQARTALKQRDSAHALNLLATYARRFPDGTLVQEATVLRVRALDQAGQSDQAGSLRKEFLDENPQSPHQPRLGSSSEE